MSQAQLLIDRFGGVTQLALAIGYSRQAVHRWIVARNKGGTGGYVPSSAMPLVEKAAVRLGIDITPFGWTP